MLHMWIHQVDLLLGLCPGVDCPVASQVVGLLVVVQVAVVLVQFQGELLLWQWLLLSWWCLLCLCVTG